MPYQPNRLDGFAEWEQLTPSVQARIGATAIELVAAWVGLNAAFSNDRKAIAVVVRAFTTANACCSDQLLKMVSEAVPAIDPERPPLPASLGEIYAYCGRHCADCRGEDCSRVGGTDGDDPARTSIPWMV
ncbi:MAG: hypothetical protein WAS21_26990 [Geminicoccaceae bacterium]